MIKMIGLVAALLGLLIIFVVAVADRNYLFITICTVMMGGIAYALATLRQK